MTIELDHVFVCTVQGAPEAERLLQEGFREGSPNVHAGQGTANRRFDFHNAMLELLWVHDAGEARSQATTKTLLWERWAQREGPASPFGICMRPAQPGTKGSPFESWEYKPAYLPPELCLYIGKAPVEEPMWVHLDFVDREQRVRNFTAHPNGAAEITGLRLTTPVALHSEASRVALANRVFIGATGPKHLLEIEIDGRRKNTMLDLRPDLPIVFHF